MTPRLLRHDVAWALAGNAGFSACQWAVLVAIARFGTASDVGAFAFGLALVGPIMMLAGLHLRAVQATDAAGTFAFGSYLGLRLLTTLAALVAISAVAWAVGGTALWPLVIALAVAKGIEAVADVLHGRLQCQEQQPRISASMLARGVVSVTAVVAALATGQGLIAAVACMTLGWLGCLLLIDLPAVSRSSSLRPNLRPATLAPLFWTALPMGGVMALGTLSVNVPRYALQASSGAAALGHFAAIAYLFVAAMQPMLAVGAVVSPRLARLYRHDLTAYQHLVRRTMLVAGGLGVALVGTVAVAGGPILAAVYAPEYAAHVRAFEWTAVATAIGFVASTFGYSVTAARRFHAQLATALLALITCAATSAWLVPSHGLVGAAWALGCTEAVRAVCGFVVYSDVVARHPANTTLPSSAPAEVARAS
jgi:O-antigen/teichoic acid export membrane protein